MTSHRLTSALKRLDALINWERRSRHDMERDLGPVEDVLERLGNPELAWAGVLVAGTKGKGSVSALIAAAMGRAGLRVGRYASPHVERVTERVIVDGEEVDEELLGEALEAALTAREAALAEGTAGGAATWFDLMTAAAFLIFAWGEVEWAIVEVGIGGRLDSTNTVDPVVGVVTNIDLEHTLVLGDTRAEIAAEKGAIMGPGTVLITGVDEDDEEAWEPLAQIAENCDGRLVSIPQSGGFDLRNRALSEAVLNELGACGVKSRDGAPLWRSFLDAEAVRGASLPARAERFTVSGVPILLDSGHVASSAELLLEQLERDPELGRKPKLIVALGREKHANAVLKAFADRVDRCQCTTAPEGRLLEAEELAELAHEAGHDEPEAWEDPLEALREAILDAEQGGGWVLVFGSFYLSGALRAELVRASVADGTDRTC